MTDEQIERAARGLSEHGKEALDWVRPCSLIAGYRRGAGEIVGLGLVEQVGPWLQITPLGLALRAHLDASHD